MLPLSIETRLGFPYHPVIGVDEVGRGCLAGPVFAAAVLLPSIVCVKTHPWLKEITDSKKLSPPMRLFLRDHLLKWVQGFSIARCEALEIDAINIRCASLKAMQKAVGALLDKKTPAIVLIDGKDRLSFSSMDLEKIHHMEPIIKGDLKCLSIAAASIIAKVARDEWMVQLDQEFPGYAFAQHKGYPTVLHYACLKAKGHSSIHRKTFLKKFLMRG